MMKFSYQDYIVKEEGNTMVVLSPERIDMNVIAGTKYIYEDRLFIEAVDVEIIIEQDEGQNEDFISFEGNRIYASEYYNPNVKVFVSL